jgi:ppGpp synthetase/RelA/SpoT-type nucleotidyltranferase
MNNYSSNNEDYEEVITATESFNTIEYDHLIDKCKSKSYNSHHVILSEVNRTFIIPVIP